MQDKKVWTFFLLSLINVYWRKVDSCVSFVQNPIKTLSRRNCWKISIWSWLESSWKTCARVERYWTDRWRQIWESWDRLVDPFNGYQFQSFLFIIYLHRYRYIFYQSFMCTVHILIAYACTCVYVYIYSPRRYFLYKRKKKCEKHAEGNWSRETLSMSRTYKGSKCDKNVLEAYVRFSMVSGS